VAALSPEIDRIVAQVWAYAKRELTKLTSRSTLFKHGAKNNAPNRAKWCKLVVKTVKKVGVRGLMAPAALKRRLEALRKAKGGAIPY
jgi:hypothetical protein